MVRCKLRPCFFQYRRQRVGPRRTPVSRASAAKAAAGRKNGSVVTTRKPGRRVRLNFFLGQFRVQELSYHSYRKRHKPLPVAPSIILRKRHFTYRISFPEHVTRSIFMASGGISMELMKLLQSDLMTILSTICGTLALLVYLTNTISHKRKLVLMLLEISAMFLMICDRRAYIYRGDTSSLGWWMVRISNRLL